MKSLLILTIGAIMLGLLSKVFSMSNSSTEDTTLKPREITFSNAKLKFSMPENFSPDFPADDLIEPVNLEDAALFEKTNKTLLLRRWWDFKESTLFSNKEVGTIMLSVYVNKSKTEYKNRFDLLTNILTDLESTHKEFNKTTEPDFQIAYPETYESFFDEIYNQQRWLRYGTSNMIITEATATYITPLSPTHYLEFSFTLMLSPAMGSREFEDKYSFSFVDAIMNSIALNYANQSSQKNLGVDANAIDIQDLVLEKTK